MKKWLLTMATISVTATPFIAIACDWRKKRQEEEKIDSFSGAKAEYSIKDEDHVLEQLSANTKSKKPKHYFLIMVDSLITPRLLDSIQKLRNFAQRGVGGKDDSGKTLTRKDIDVVNEKVDFFNQFEIKANVMTPGWFTDKGFQGVIGGAYGAITTTEYMRTGVRNQLIDDAWMHLFKSIGSTDNIEEMYFSNTQFFKAQNPRDATNDSWKLEDLKLSDKVKGKIKLDLQPSPEWEENDIMSNAVENIDATKNTFSFIVSDVVHDTRGYWTYPLGDEWDDSVEADTPTLFSTFLHFKRALVKKGIWDDSEIIITSDHGRKSVFGKDNSNKKFTMNKAYREKMIDIYKSESSLDDYDKELHFSNTKKKIETFDWKMDKITGNDDFMSAQSTLLYKPINSPYKKPKVDFENVYANFDAISQLYHDIGIDPYYLKFNYYPYTQDFEDKENINGDFNSYISDPLHRDLSKRRLLSFDPNQEGWGVFPSLWWANSGIWWNGPWWIKNQNDEVVFNPHAIRKIILDDKISNKKDWNKDDTNNSPWLDQLRQKYIKKGPTKGFELLGKIFSALSMIK